jgi:hypothetical protein
MQTSYKCPICSQSIVNMEMQFRNLDRAIESQPMPPEFQDTKAIVSCNDCYAKSLVKYHWLGLKCAICDSYNTAQLQILSGAEAGDPVVAYVADVPHAAPAMGSNPAAPRPTFPSIPGPARLRRHSSHLRSGFSSDETDSSRFSPYHVPQRLGRSVSPFRTSELSIDSPGPGQAADHAGESENEDDDDIEFWGGSAPRSATSGGEGIEEDEESEDDSVASIDEVDDDDDVEDRMELLGHR